MELNLANPSKSEIKFTISKFPDGQQQVKIESIGKLFALPIVFVISRLNNFKDLELIFCAVASLRNIGVKEIHLVAPYILGARSDRKFEEGSNNYLKDVMCPLINSLRFDSVEVLDPHSDCLEMGINNFNKVENNKFVKWALLQINNKNDAHEKTIFISPDGGALKKIYKVADYVNFKGDILTCSKERGTDGKLTNTIVPFFDLTKDVVIIDDICDGGATFINIAKEIKDRNFTGKIYLIVTHGIFSKGFGELQQYFDAIYTTNSYQNIEAEPFIKQLNIF